MLPGRGIESELVSSSGFELSGGTLILKDFFFSLNITVLGELNTFLLLDIFVFV